jgi:HD-GYP domain-containing protein (c-di-GMP phosphodiesterase class II)
VEEKSIIEFITTLMTAISNCVLYTEKHPLLKESIPKLITALDNLYAADSVVFTLLGDRLVFNENLLGANVPHLHIFAKKLKRKGLERVILRKGIGPEELTTFIAGMASRERVSSSQHITVGMIELSVKLEGDSITDLLNKSALNTKEIFDEISQNKGLNLDNIEKAVVGIVSTLKREQDVLRVMSPLKSYSDYTYVHATNVSVLTLFQAEAIGFQGELLHEIGVAGLLHDVGKMFVPREMLEKTAKLNEKEWGVMKQHTLYGARYLATQPDIPRLALIAAYEHHMKYDGKGYPAPKRRGHKQHMVSQLISISDFYDALRTERPYRKSMDITTVLGLMKEETGKIFNPLLVDNFLKALGFSGAI